jgi:hypothetical protein
MFCFRTLGVYLADKTSFTKSFRLRSSFNGLRDALSNFRFLSLCIASFIGENGANKGSEF